MFAGHSIDGRHFLGLRMGRQGRYEIVYEGADTGQRLIWTIKSQDINADVLGTQLRAAQGSSTMSSTLAA